MIKLFLTKILNNLKKPISLIKEKIYFFNVAFPGLLTNIFVVLFCYGIWKALSLISWSVKLDNAYNTISSTIWSYLTLNDIWFILIVLGLVLLNSILKFLNKRKIAKKPLTINRSPIIGIPNKDNVTVLLMLFNLRCLEIGILYLTIQRFQKEADKQGVKDNWIELFFIHYFDLFGSINDEEEAESDEEEVEREQNNKEIASKLSKEKFLFKSFFSSDDYASPAKDLLIVLKKYEYVDSIKHLQGISLYGELSNTMPFLIELYKKFNSCDDSIFIQDKPFTENLKSEIIKAHDIIDEIWEEIVFALKSSLIFLKMQNDTYFDIEKILKEIEALRALQDSRAIRTTMKLVRFSSEPRSFFVPSKKHVKLILDKLKQNPLSDLY